MITVVSMYAQTNDSIAVATLNLEDGATATGTDSMPVPKIILRIQ